MVENLYKMGKEIVIQVQETQRVPNRIKPKQNIPRHLLVSISVLKQRSNTNSKYWKQEGKATNSAPGDSHKDYSWSFNRNSSGQKGMAGHTWSDEWEKPTTQIVVQILLYPARISFKYEGEIKSFTDKQKLREFSTIKPALQQILKDLL